MKASVTKLLLQARNVGSYPLPIRTIRLTSVRNGSTISKEKRSVNARSGSKWDDIYMETLGIKVIDAVDEQQFFGFSLPESFLRQDDITILEAFNLTTEENIERESRNRNNPPHVQLLLNALLLSLYYSSDEESAVGDLGKALLRVVGFLSTEGFCVAGPKQLLLNMCGKTKYANPDIVLLKIGLPKVLLVVQQDKRAFGASYSLPEPQLAANMLAAYAHNRIKCKVDHQTMYGIILQGTLITFYKCDIDSKIYSSIRMGYQQEGTIMNVVKFSIAESDSPRCIVESNRNMSNTLRCLEAIRILLTNEVGKPQT
jgi:hypothetical protein